MAKVSSYRVLGGPGDGKTLPRAAVPPLAEGQVVGVRPAGADYLTHRYRRRGDTLLFVETLAVLRWRGGPCDGKDVLPTEAAAATPEGDCVVVPVGTDRYAWYRRRGSDLVYEDTTAAHEMEVVGGP